MQAYTYTIYHKVSNQYYYGVRKSSTFDLGVNYFSSSKLVKRLLSESPLDQFEFKLRRKFNSYSEARCHETRFLQRINAVKNKKMLNQAISAAHVPTKDSMSEKQRHSNISTTMKKLWQDPEYRKNSGFIISDPVEASRRGRVGNAARIAGYKSGRISRKEKLPVVYQDVTLTKNGAFKIVKANQVPAYRKYGWERPLP